MIFHFCPTKIGFLRGVGGSLNVFLHENPNILGDIGAHAKFQNRSINPFGRKVCGGEERKIILKIVDTLFRSNANGQCTHSAQTKKIIIKILYLYLSTYIYLYLYNYDFCK
jgi:hypothetical protein